MCYAAMARPDLEECLQEYDAFLDTDMFEYLFWERAKNPSAGIKFPIAIDRYFLQSQRNDLNGIREAITAYRAIKVPAWEQEVFNQRRRHADAERALKKKITKKAETDLRVSKNKIRQHVRWLEDMKTMENKAGDTAVHPMNYAPVIVQSDKGRMLTAMRYHCRLAGKPSTIDHQMEGLYNARKTSLQNWWAPVFGTRHALLAITGFRENVKQHDMEHRELKPDEKEVNVVLEFTPKTHQVMLVPCVWDRWVKGDEVLNSFALITDDPPPEVAAAGHNRCPINLSLAAAGSWLIPQGQDTVTLLNVLEDRQRPYYEHLKVAA